MTTVKSITDLNLCLVKNLHIIQSQKIDLIVGIPRSGIIVSSLLSTHLQLPMADLESYLSGNYFIKHGQTQPVSSNMKILLVDDSINTSRQMRIAYEKVKSKYPAHTVIRFAVYSSKKTKDYDIDIALEQCPLPRAFQWNFWKHKDLKNWATDLDGVLCRDPLAKIENDKGGPKLLQFYKTADKKFPLQQKIKYIITARFERYRSVTEEWLRKNNIQYDNLIMKPDDCKLTHAQFKAQTLNRLSDVKLYIESNDKQAKAIFENTKLSVWCTDTQRAYNK